jgi:DNA ligase 1
MKLFVELVDRLTHAPSHRTKVALLVDYLRRAPDPDRGLAISLLVGEQGFARLSAAGVRKLGEGRIDPVLFSMSRDFVGDLAETKALMWPERASNHDVPRLQDVIGDLTRMSRADASAGIEPWLDTMTATERWVLLKLVTGNLSLGISPALVRRSLAAFGGVDVGEIEGIWHGVESPYSPIFDWLERGGEKPSLDGMPMFHPVMRALPLDTKEVLELDLSKYAVEWKWDGLEVQLSVRGGDCRLYSNDGDDISEVFPAIVGSVREDCVLVGALLAARDREAGAIESLRLPLTKKTATALKNDPRHVHFRLSDILFEGREDLRDRPYEERRCRLDALLDRVGTVHSQASEHPYLRGKQDLVEHHGRCRERGALGLMFKRRDSIYSTKPPAGDWYEWRREPLILSAVLMYVQSGSTGLEATLGAWRHSEQGLELVPVGRSFLGSDVAEDDRFDKWLRAHTVKRHGPVSEIEPILVMKVAFDGVIGSKRRKAGLVLRDPSVRQILWDNSASDADHLVTLERWLD